MKIGIKKSIVILLMINLLASITLPVFAIGSEKAVSKESKLITIKPEQIIDENIFQIKDTFINKAQVLLDDQDKLPQTPRQLSNEEKDALKDTVWKPATRGDFKTVDCYIDLKTTYRITHIGFYDTYGNPEVEFLQGSPFHWKSITKQKLTAFKGWKVVEVANVETQYLQIKASELASGLSEIALYGYQTGEDPVEEEKPNVKPNFDITIDEAIGANGFIDDRLSELKALGHVREYHNFRWVLDDKLGQNKFAPSYGGKWNFDDYYKMLYDNNIEAIPCIQGTSKALLSKEYLNSGKATMNEKTNDIGTDPSLPASYKTHASTMFQYAARYGSQKVDESKLLLASDQEKKTGLGYITYYENNNEPDKTWEGTNSYYSPYELAAMCSADYDGHEKTMGDTYGIKNADPNSKLVLGGLCSGTTQYLDLMKLWFENNRSDKKMAFDVINFHTYCGTQAPEENGFKQRCEEVVNWRNINAPDKEVWLTEFGWDTNINSPHAAPTQEAQGDWLIRSYLLSFAAGIDRSSMYMLRDAGWAGSPGSYATSGLVTEKGAWTKKPSWYYVYTLKETLEGYVFDKVIEESNNKYVYRFKKEGTTEYVYAIWSPTSNGSSYQDSLEIGQASTKATLTTMQDGVFDGKRTRLTIQNGKVKIPVSESPVFVSVSGIPDAYPEPTIHKIEVNTNMINVETQNNKTNLETTNGKLDMTRIQSNFSNLFDEQKAVTNFPEERYTGSVKTKWEVLWPYTVFPVDCEINLGKTYHITQIGIYDSTGQGKISFYGGSPKKWDEQAGLENNLPVYNQWKVYDVDMKSQYIKILKQDNAEAYEIAFFGYSLDEKNEDPNEALNHPKPNIETTVYKMNGAEIYNISPETTVREFKQNITCNVAYQILDSKGKEQKDEDIIGTEMIIKAGDLQYTLVVSGDMNGDGKVSVMDLVLLKRTLVELDKPTKQQLRAVDFNFDNTVSVVDLVTMKRVLVGFIKL